MKVKVLLVDDDAAVLDVLERNFRIWSDGDWEVSTASSVGKAIKLLNASYYDVLISDMCMPVVDGLQFLRLLQHVVHRPIHRNYS